MWAALGGDAGWAQAGQIRFSVEVESGGKVEQTVRHAWDRVDGRARVEWRGKQNDFVAMVDIGSGRGAVEIDSKPAPTAEARREISQQALTLHQRNLFVFLAPFLLRRGGAHFKYEGPRKGPAGADCEVVSVTLEPAEGPGTKYWLYLSPRTHLPERLEYEPQGRPGKLAGQDFGAFAQVGPLRLSLERTILGGSQRLFYKDARVEPSADVTLYVPRVE
jgi:hypothetical protein